MNPFAFSLLGQNLVARGSGALWWPAAGLLCVSDLHLGKAKRIARRGGALLPPYETGDTLARLDSEIAATGAQQVVCLGDSFDDLEAAAELAPHDRIWLTRLRAGRDWTWIAGNHDPGPPSLGGSHRTSLTLGPLAFRHIAEPGATGEISGHFHPKAALSFGGARVSRPCFLIDRHRVVMPAFGTYTGGLSCTDPVLATLMRADAIAVLTGATPHAVPMVPRRAAG